MILSMFFSKYVYQPLKQALESGKPILKEKYIKDLFSSSLEEILQCNEKLRSELSNRIKTWSAHQCVGDVFLAVVCDWKNKIRMVWSHLKLI